MKKILLLGGTGAMGIYLTPKLIERGCSVDVVSLDDKESTCENLRYIKANGLDNDFLAELLKNRYDGIVDFLMYKNTTDTFGKRMNLLLENTGHYIYLSSYRVYADDFPITEESPRLLDVSEDKEFCAAAETEYSQYKAIGENLLRASGFKNWTIIRPAITYSSFRFQLVTLEANVLIQRAVKGQTVLLPKGAMNIQATMSWAGDVAEMISRLLLNDRAKCEAYTVSTSEHHTWGEIAEMYSRIAGLKYEIIDDEDFVSLFPENWIKVVRWQLKYDREFNRIIDNSKILKITGMKQEELMPLEAGLKMEFDALPKDHQWPPTEMNEKMDNYLKGLNK